MPLKTHGHAKKGKHSKTYRSWIAMKKRCTYEKHPHFSHYSKLGLFPEWENSFEAFLRDVGAAPSEKHSLERADTLLGYFPGNVKWATKTEQMRNRSDTATTVLNGVKISLMSICEKYGIKRSTLKERLRRGYKDDQLIAPVGTFQRWRPAHQ